jgi:hypothetical protein
MNGFWLDFFSFRKMVSSAILKFVYVMGLIAITLAGIGQLFSNPLNGIGIIIVGNLFWRIFCESLILLFSIQQELVKINQKQ